MSKLLFKKTNAQDLDFKTLIKSLDQDLAITDGEEHSFYNQFNGTDNINHVLVAYENSIALSCGAFKIMDSKVVEIKRMYTVPSYRGKGLAALVLKNLEEWASKEGFKCCVLETGTRQIAAIRLYEKCGYQIIENYGQYKGVINSCCFEKAI
jgi:GNAT superfamily N-acetyltransferase